MGYKTILVPLGGDNNDALLGAAASIARRFDGRVEALYVRQSAKDAIPFLTEGASSELIRTIVTAAEKEGAERAATARKAFEQCCSRCGLAVTDKPSSGAGVSAWWHEETGRESEHVARLGRLVDLLVVARPKGESPAPETLESALLETGRPVLVIPPAPPDAFGDSIAIGWNGSIQAVHAVTAALPLISAAKSVTVLTTTESVEAQAKPEELVRYLGWHGIAAAPRGFSAGSKTGGQALLDEARAGGATLLVMGGYGHSRVREMMLGGVTRHVLASAEIPVLMAH